FEPVIRDAPVVLRRRAWRDRPEQYCVLVTDRGESWITRSRTWALLVAHSLARKTEFELFDDGTIRRLARTQGYLPLPVARALCLAGAGAAGIHSHADGVPTYEYPVADSKQVIAICGALILRETRPFLPIERWKKAMPRPHDPAGLLPT